MKETAGIPESVSLRGMNSEKADIFTSAGNDESERIISAKGKCEKASDFSKQGASEPAREVLCKILASVNCPSFSAFIAKWGKKSHKTEPLLQKFICPVAIPPKGSLSENSAL